MTDKQLNLNDILNISDSVKKRIDVPQWGGYVIIQSMTAEARDAYEESLFSRKEDGDFERNFGNTRAKLVSACVLGPDGTRMFKTEQHVKMLGTKSAKVLEMLFSECQKINAISDADVEELSGKSEADQP